MSGECVLSNNNTYYNKMRVISFIFIFFVFIPLLKTLDFILLKIQKLKDMVHFLFFSVMIYLI